METSNQIYKSMAKILKDVDAIGKDKKVSITGGANYDFRGIDDMYNTLHKIFAENSVFIIPEVLETTLETQEKEKEWNNKITKSLQYSVLVKIKFTFYAEDGSSVSAIGIGHALDTGDKGTNKAQSSALKYCLMQTFLIPTIEDKDVENSDLSVNKKITKPVEKPIEKLIASPPKPVEKQFTEFGLNKMAQDFIIRIENNKNITKEFWEKLGEWLAQNSSEIKQEFNQKLVNLILEKENKIVNIEPNLIKKIDKELANFDPNYTN